MEEFTRAVVQTADRTYEIQKFRLPELGPDDAILRVERCGVCGTDVKVHDGLLNISGFEYPVVPGHEPVGIIERIGPDAAERWGVGCGDRVVLESPVPCNACRYCAAGAFLSCDRQQVLGFVPTSRAPGLWGGFAGHLYLAPTCRPHKISKSVPLDVAATFNAVACGFGWVDEAGVRAGDTVLILGAGQRGLACVIAAKARGARRIIISGLTRDRRKLDVAVQLGAERAVNVESEDLEAVVHDICGDDLPDVVLDLAPMAPETVVHALALVRKRGTVALAGLKGDHPVEGLLTDVIVDKAVLVRGLLGKSGNSYEHAIGLMEQDPERLLGLHTHTFSLEEASKGIDVIAGRVDGEEGICVSIAPHES